MKAREVPTKDQLLGLVDALVGQPVVAVADLVADRFITGTPKRISREAPVLILQHESEIFTPGGGANAVANIAALGGNPLPLGVVGDDESGREITDSFSSQGIDVSGIIQRDGYRTPTKTRVLGGGQHSIKQQIVRYDIEDHLDLAPADIERYRAAIDNWEERPRVAIFSDYGYGAADPALLHTVRSALVEDGLVLGDSRYRLQAFEGIDGATPNEEEALALSGVEPEGAPGDFLRIGRKLLARLRAQFLLITTGSSGMTLFESSGAFSLPVHGTSQVADVTGAGDTVIATVALATAAGASPAAAALLANYAGGVVVMKMGTATLQPKELKEAIKVDSKPLVEAKWAEY
jgi:rfaE bifunctional protein kinase chain/domain